MDDDTTQTFAETTNFVFPPWRVVHVAHEIVVFSLLSVEFFVYEQIPVLGVMQQTLYLFPQWEVPALLRQHAEHTKKQ